MAPRKPPVERKASIEDALGQAFSEFTALGEEMREWADNMQEKFPTKSERIGEAADTLENITEIDVPEALRVVEVDWQEKPTPPRGFSRPDRRDQATAILSSVIHNLEQFRDDDANEKNEDLQSAASDLIDEVQSALDEADGVDFSGR